MSGPDISPFPLDRFQLEAIAAIDLGQSVLVAAPTGSGKTVVAEHALRRALGDGDKAFYTTPVKALSNQKYHDLVAEHGEAKVGLLTGDRSINSEAPLVVMTTEVLRNMLYAHSDTLDGLRWVVLDEVHYLRDRARGAVWEEVIIHAPPHIQMVALSATVSNVEEFADWIRHVRGPTTLVTETHRPVDLTHLEMVDVGPHRPPLLLPVFVDGVPNPDGAWYDKRRGRGNGGDRRRSERRRPTEPRTPRRTAVVAELARLELVPAIYFLFSRAGCDDARRVVGAAGLGLTSPADQARIAAIARRHVATLTVDERRVLGWSAFRDSLVQGVAAHHAGLVPAFKELVEECFLEGLVKVVFATETLALGINMPARTVVIERLTKFTGQTHETLTPLEYTQLTGRAGRRGLDTTGTAIVLWSPWVGFDELSMLAGSTDYPLRSAFRLSYNMAANLVAGFERDEAHRLLRLSFAQFQFDRSVVDIERRRGQLIERAEALEPDAVCELGSVAEVARRRADLADMSRGRVRGALAQLRPGAAIIGPGDDGEAVVVVSVAHRRNGVIRLRAVDERGRDLRFSVDDFAVEPVAFGHVELPRPFDPASVRFRSAVAKRLRMLDRRMKPQVAPARGGLSPGAEGCPDLPRHLDAHRELLRVRKKLRRIERRLTENADSIDRKFEELCALLEDRRCLRDWDLTEKGRLLLGVFHSSDLLVVEALSDGLFDDLDAPSLAALVSCITFESRTDERTPRQRVPSSTLRERIDRLDGIAAELVAQETEVGQPLTARTDEGFVATAHQWADGGGLSAVIDEDLTGGDFVRQMKQLIDLLRQIGLVAPRPLTASVARQAAAAIDRGVVAAESA